MASPFYPGYYPGERIIRRPSGGERFPKGPLYEFKDPNDILAAIEQDLESASDLLMVPRWVKDRMLRDLKRTLTVEAIPKGHVSVEAEISELYGAEEELPGAFGTSVNFNPVDWVKDPVKELKKFPKSVWKNVTSFADIDLRNERAFWSRVLNVQGPLGLGGWHESAYRTAADVVGGKELLDMPLTSIGLKKKTKEKIYDLGSKQFVQAEIDVFDDVKTKFLVFINVSKNPGSRPVKYSAFRKASMEAVKAEIEHFKSIGALTGLSIDQKLAVEGFLVKVDLALAMDATTSNLSGLKKGLSKVILEGGGTDLASKFSDVSSNVTDSRNRIRDIRNLYGADLGKSLEKELVRYESYLTKMESSFSKVAVGVSRNYTPIQAIGDIGLKGALGVVGDQHQILNRGNLFQNRGNIYKGGLKDNYYDLVLGEDLIRRGSVLNGIFDAKGLEGSKRLGWLNEVGKRKRDWEHGGDFISTWERGDVLNLHLWNFKIRDRIQAWTPAYYVQEFIFERTHSFGAKISKSKKVYKFWDSLVESERLSLIFQNRFTLKLSAGDVKVVGGEHFGVALSTFKKLGDKKFGDIEVDAATKAISFVDAGRRNDFIRFINTKFRDIGDKGAYQFDAKDIGGMKKQLGKMKGLKKWLLDNKNKLGLTLDGRGNIKETAENFKRLEEVFRKLSTWQGLPASLDITKKFVGWLEKITSKISLAQSEVLKRASKFLAPITLIKITISEAVADAFATGIAVASAGIGTAIAPAVRLVTRYVVKKTLDFGQAVANVIKEADFNKLMDEMDESAQKTIKWIVAGCGCTFLPIALSILFITTVITAVISPYDPTKKPPMQLDQVSAFWDPAYDQYLGITGTQSSIKCFKFVNADGTMNGRRLTAWDPGEISSVFEPAINRLQLGGDGYMDRLCSDGDIELYRTYDSPNYCGHVFGNSKILFIKPLGHYCYNNADYTAYFFAHETGHIYDGRSGGSSDWDIFWDSVRVEGTLPSYPGACRATNTVGEDFAETIGDYIWKNTRDCGDWSWGSYPNHFEFAQNILFR